LTSAPDWGELSALRSGRFTSGKEPHHPLDRRYIGPQTRSDPCLYKDSNPEHPPDRYTDWDIPIPPPSTAKDI
jgi:hypothetical protein